MHLGIISAITREYELVKERFGKEFETKERCGLEFLTGMQKGNRITLVRCGVGKVAAAFASTLLCGHFCVDRILFVGCAGGLKPGLKCGDIVVAERAGQHDMDARPFCEVCVIPDVNIKYFEATQPFLAELIAAARNFAETSYLELPGAKEFGITKPSVISGVICTGDLFVSTKEQVADIRAKMPEADAVEMEGAAVAEVAAQAKVPWGIVRVISDDGSAMQFDKFADVVVGQVSLGIIEAVIKHTGLKE